MTTAPRAPPQQPPDPFYECPVRPVNPIGQGAKTRTPPSQPYLSHAEMRGGRTRISTTPPFFRAGPGQSRSMPVPDSRPAWKKIRTGFTRRYTRDCAGRCTSGSQDICLSGHGLRIWCDPPTPIAGSRCTVRRVFRRETVAVFKRISHYSTGGVMRYQETIPAIMRGLLPENPG